MIYKMYGLPWLAISEVLSSHRGLVRFRTSSPLLKTLCMTEVESRQGCIRKDMLASKDHSPEVPKR